MLRFSFSNSTKSRAIKPEFFERIILKSLKHLKLEKRKTIVDLAIVGNSESRKLNKKYRGKDKPTDVLSFSFTENSLELTQKSPFLFLGNIVICLPVAQKDAQKENPSTSSGQEFLKEKLAKLTIHGLLHLLGYNHEGSKKEREKMEKLEIELVRKCVST